MLAMKLLTAASAAPTDEIAYLSHSTIRAATSSAFDVSRPASVAAGDLLIAFYYHNNTATLTLPSGWSVLRNAVPPDDAGKFAICTRVAGSSEPSTYSFRSTSTAGQGVAIVAFRGGYGQVSVLGAQAGSDSLASITAAGITMTGGGPLLMFAAAEGASQAVTEGPAGMSQVFEAEMGPRMTLYSEARGAGATGTRSITWAMSGVGKTAVLLALR